MTTIHSRLRTGPSARGLITVGLVVYTKPMAEYFPRSVVGIAPTALIDHVARFLGNSLLKHVWQLPGTVMDLWMGTHNGGK
jgi:hypothetical protein